MRKTKPTCLIVLQTLCLQLMAGVAIAENLTDLPDVIKQNIEKTFPDSKITKTEKEKWKGKIVTEVELIAADGVHYEVFISDEGIIQKIEEEDDWKWFSK